jgi:hypothetical protein
LPRAEEDEGDGRGSSPEPSLALKVDFTRWPRGETPVEDPAWPLEILPPALETLPEGVARRDTRPEGGADGIVDGVRGTAN